MTRAMKVFVIASFVALYGMQAVMFALLMKPEGIRMHAPRPGIALPREATVAGDAWMRGGLGRIEVRVRDAATGAAWTVAAERDAIRYRGKVVSLLAGWKAKVAFPAEGRYTLQAVVVGADGRTVETPVRPVRASASAVSREFVFLSPAHLAALAAVLVLCVAVPWAVRRAKSDVVRDRVGLAIVLALYVHEVAYEVYWFAIGAWTVGNCLMLHMCALALMFLPVLYFSREGIFRQVLFELLFFFGLGGAMQALFTPDIGLHGFPEFKYFNYFFSHGTIVLGLVYAAVCYRLELTWKSWIRIAAGTIGLALAMYGLNQLFRLIPPYEPGNYFIMGYPPPTGSVIDVFAAIFGPAPRYLVGLTGMGVVLLGILYLPYPIGRALRRRAAARARG